jgi:preprotein translocase subunit SecF
MFIVKYRKIWFLISAVFVGLSLYAWFGYGPNLSIDFTGGTLTEIRYEAEVPEKVDVEELVSLSGIEGFSVRAVGDSGYIIRTKELTEEEKSALNASFASSSFASSIERQSTVGPVAGETLKSKAVTAVMVVVLMIVLFVTFAFRKASQSWKYGLATIIALAHDVVIPTGAFIFLGHLYGLEIDLLFVSGLLAIIGYSVHDTIVVFDRVRENLSLSKESGEAGEFEVIVGKSVMQTIGRSINTSLTLLIMLIALYFLGSSATRDFSLLLIIGVIAGTYSSVFLASPLLVSLNRKQ